MRQVLYLMRYCVINGFHIKIKIRTATTGFHKGKPFTILGAKKLNDCVRYGNRWILLAIITVLILLFIEILYSLKTK